MSLTPKMSMSGAEKMRAKLKRLAEKFPDEVARALYQETEVEVKEVKMRTPVDTGTLRGTVHQVGPFRNGRMIYSLIAAGGPAAPYAIYVHENLEAHHPVGQAKFIESVIMESRPYLAARVAKRIELNRALS
jgi:hypothetical protein